MMMNEQAPTDEQVRARLMAAKAAAKAELLRRVDRIHEHARDPLEADSSEQAAQLGNVQVVSALESEAVEQVAEIDAALQRLELGQYGRCLGCGEQISAGRLQAMPAATLCVSCAENPTAG
jgi:RNA polymerase-binding transcription factor DksA